MTEMIRHPSVMEKAQAEVRKSIKGKRKITETDIQGLSYLQSVIKETLRLHPPIPLLLHMYVGSNVKLVATIYQSK